MFNILIVNKQNHIVTDTGDKLMKKLPLQIKVHFPEFNGICPNNATAAYPTRDSFK